MGHIAYFLSDSDWCNKRIISHLEDYGHKVDVIPIQGYHLDLSIDPRKWPHDLYINRVYPSSVCRNEPDYIKISLELTHHLEAMGKKVVNGFSTVFMDYSKSECMSQLRKLGIATPRSWMVADKKAALRLSKELEFPKIVKMDTGGMSLNVSKVNNLKEFQDTIDKLASDEHIIHIEEFIPPPGYVVRIAVIGNKFRTAHKKTLIDGGWLGSCAQGSDMSEYTDIPKKLIDKAEYISRELNMPIAGYDVIEAEDNDYFVDLNPTPVYGEKNLKFFGIDSNKLVADYFHELIEV